MKIEEPKMTVMPSKLATLDVSYGELYEREKEAHREKGRKRNLRLRSCLPN